MAAEGEKIYGEEAEGGRAGLKTGRRGLGCILRRYEKGILMVELHRVLFVVFMSGLYSRQRVLRRNNQCLFATFSGNLNLACQLYRCSIRALVLESAGRRAG